MSMMRNYDEYDQVCKVIINSNSFLLFVPPNPYNGFVGLDGEMNRENCVRANNTEKAKFIRNKKN